MQSYVSDAGGFLVDTLFTLYMLIVLLRFLLQIVRADFNPLTRAIIAVTEPPLAFLRRFVPGLYGIDLAPIALLFIVACVKRVMLLVMHGVMPGVGAVLVMALADCLQLVVFVLIAAVFIQAILSWFGPPGYNPAVRLLRDITEPLLSRVRKVIPMPGGVVDLSPIVVIIVLTMLRKLVVQPIADFGVLLLQ